MAVLHTPVVRGALAPHSARLVREVYEAACRVDAKLPELAPGKRDRQEADRSIQGRACRPPPVAGEHYPARARLSAFLSDTSNG